MGGIELYIGVDLGGTNIGVGIVSDEGKVIEEISAPTHNERAFDEIAKDILSLIEKVKNKISNIKALGLGLPGTIDVEKGIFVSAPNIKVDNFNIKGFFERKLETPTFVDNDANCAALAESIFGVTREYDNSITTTLGTGIGAGIIVNKSIFRGLGNCAGEVGHMVIRQNGSQCGCGRKGCWEQYASTSALMRMAVEAAKENKNSVINKLAGWDFERISSRLVFEAADQGDHVAILILNEYFKNVAEGLANIINIIAPEAVAIGGSVSRQGERLLTPIRNFISQNTQCKSVKLPEIVTAEFGREAGMIGAAMLGRQNR